MIWMHKLQMLEVSNLHMNMLIVYNYFTDKF